MKFLTTTTIFIFLFFNILFAFQSDLETLKIQADKEKSPSLYMELAEKYFEEGELSYSKKNAEKALANALDKNDEYIYAQSNQLLGEISVQRFDYTNAMNYFIEALDNWKKNKNEEGVAKVNRYMGRIFYFQNDYTNALVHLNRSKERYEKLGKEKKLAGIYKDLADVYLAQNFYGKAKNTYTTAFELYVKEEAFKKAASIARFLGKTSRDLGDYEGALVYFSQSLDLHGSMEDLPNIAKDYNDLTLTLIDQRNYEEAKENNAIAYDLRSELKDSLGIAESLKNFGVIHAINGEREAANSFLVKSADLLKQVPIQEKIPDMFKEVAHSYSILGLYEKAFQYEKEFAESQKALFDKDKATALFELTTRYESESEAEEQKQQIALLERDKATNARMRIFLLLVIGLIATSLGLLFYNFQRKKKDNLILKEKNEEILWQKEEIKLKNTQLEEKAASLDLLNNKLVSEMAERESIERSSFARDSFLAMMSHQMRTPINIIVGLTHLLLEENPREDQKESLRNLQFSANNLVVFINDVLDYSKIEAGKLVMKDREFKLLQVIEDVNKWSKIPAEEKDVTLIFEVEKTVPEILIGDPTRLNQIITNLISSSLNYTDNEKIKTSISLFQLNEKEVTLEILIEDKGRGIEKAKLEEMFRKFTRDPEADIYDGLNTSGLELAITKRLVDLQNGRIEAHSEIGKGTIFKVYLPYTLPTKHNINKPTEEKSLLPYHYLVGKKIMVVEDNKINSLVVRKMLEKLGVVVTTADNGLEALDQIKDTYFDLILMDIQMPKMDGYRATSEIRKSPDPKIASVPIIALTASAYLTEKEKAQLFGMDDHVGKPFGPDELMEKISNCLAKKDRGVRVVRGGLN